ncbi:oxygenase MpaB family protein [Mycobacterium sp. Aquia_216]|uniref:oxygenase MpaB family protein n=1 Tax=Mycobacterium sp. Aquia_216 TaxID=2991729 RepID=UPI00227CEE9D|nr:oxygenase MpaB family protein [Mycobacterium sp. Aquia_216]WAJ42716.1 oxygenase MpaB family protein [Mycobacterium sp. Aquia_216]
MDVSGRALGCEPAAIGDPASTASDLGAAPGNHAVVWASDPQAPDRGYFGPNSMAWTVLSAPAVTLMIAQITNLLEAPHVDFQSVLIDHDPLFPTNSRRQRGSVLGQGGRFHDRIGRTVAVPLPILFGDRRSAQDCARRLFDYHRPMRGTSADNGASYAATDPATMLFAAVTITHAGLLAYENFAFSGITPPRRLSPALRDQYLAEMVELAVLMGVPRAQAPSNTHELADYYASVSGKFTSRKGWRRAQRRTATALLRPAGLADLRRLVADVSLMGSAVLAAAALPAPSRRLNGIPRIADPFLAICRLLGLPLFAVLQTCVLGRSLRSALIGADNVAAVDQARALALADGNR